MLSFVVGVVAGVLLAVAALFGFWLAEARLRERPS